MTTKPTEKKAYRAFWIEMNTRNAFAKAKPDGDVSNMVHVIEYAAFTESQERIEKLREELKNVLIWAAVDPESIKRHLENHAYSIKEFEAAQARIKELEEEITDMKRTLSFKIESSLRDQRDAANALLKEVLPRLMVYSDTLAMRIERHLAGNKGEK